MGSNVQPLITWLAPLATGPILRRARSFPKVALRLQRRTLSRAHPFGRTKGLRALCQEPGQRPNRWFLFYVSASVFPVQRHFIHRLLLMGGDHKPNLELPRLRLVAGALPQVPCLTTAECWGWLAPSSFHQRTFQKPLFRSR